MERLSGINGLALFQYTVDLSYKTYKNIYNFYNNSTDQFCSTSELKSTQLERNKAIAHLNDMHKCIKVIGCNDEAIALQYAAPPAKQKVTTQTVLQ